jgi:hypothetical protein
MCNSAPVAGPPLQLPLGQTLTQVKPKIEPGDNQGAASSSAAAPSQPSSASRGHKLNIAV